MLRQYIVTLALLTQMPVVLAADPILDVELASWVDQRVRDWQPKPEEKRFDEIGWTSDIRDGLRLAKEHDRPLFLFTHDGRMGIGRC